MALRGDHQHAVGGHTPAGETRETRAHVGREPGPGDVEAQLDRGRELVDVLSARAGRADEAFLDVALVDRDGAGDADHSANLHRRGRAWLRAADRAGENFALKRDDFSSNRHRALTSTSCWSMIFSENRYPLFGIML